MWRMHNGYKFENLFFVQQLHRKNAGRVLNRDRKITGILLYRGSVIPGDPRHTKCMFRGLPINKKIKYQEEKK